LKRALKWVFGIAGSLVALLIAAVLVVLARPELVINDRALPFGARMAAKAGLDLKWKTGHVAIESLGLLEKRVRLDFAGLCVRMPSQGVDGCFEKATVVAAAAFRDWALRITEIGPVDIRGEKVAYTVVESEPDAKEASSEDSKDSGGLSELIASAKIQPIRISLPDWKFTSGETQLAGQADLDSRTGDRGEARIRLDAKADLGTSSAAGRRQHFEAKAELENPRGFMEAEGWKLGMDALARLPDGTRAKVRAELDPRGKDAGPMAYAYSLKGEYSKGRSRAHARLAGEVSPDSVVARVTADARGFVDALPHAWIEGCEIAISRQASETQPGALKMNCPVYADVPVPPKGFPPVALPAKAGVRLMADLKSGAYPPAWDAPVDGKVSMELEPVLTPLLEGEGKVESQVAGVPDAFPKNWKMDTDLGLKVKIASFERLVKQLSNTPYDVWAPLRVLKGTVEAGVEGRFDANSGTAPVSLKTRLASESQTLDVDASGQFKIERLQPRPKMSLAMDVALTDVKLELPPLPALPTPARPKPDPLPQLFPDDRFKSSKELAQAEAEAAERARQQAGRVEEPLFTYDVRVRTAEARPVRLVTSQIKDPVPLAVNIALKSDAPVGGSIRVLSFPLQLFKRDVTLDHLTLSLRQPSKDSELDGRIVIPYTDYTITILLLGTTDKPQIKFLSEPPLPDDQIIAVLIFGQSIDALDPDQQASVGNSRAALRQGALSLFSLYYLSSMNIESIDYDPGSKTASLKYRLAEGTTLNLSQGTGGGQPSVGLRKRLTKHFALTTTLNNPSPQQADRTVSTFLEWAYQY
jgi:hypothetical protein